MAKEAVIKILEFVSERVVSSGKNLWRKESQNNLHYFVLNIWKIAIK